MAAAAAALKLSGAARERGSPRRAFDRAMMKLATFNVNGIKTRLPQLLDWLAKESPDVVCLQELKALDGVFPRAER
jgi:endonuclease/exonuclease/phosphatase (EEP) superfamily protein YafD